MNETDIPALVALIHERALGQEQRIHRRLNTERADFDPALLRRTADTLESLAAELQLAKSAFRERITETRAEAADKLDNFKSTLTAEQTRSKIAEAKISVAIERLIWTVGECRSQDIDRVATDLYKILEGLRD